MSRLKILQLIDRPFLGGGQTAVLNLARGLDRRRFEVAVASATGGPFVDAVRAAGVRHLPADIGKTAGSRAVRELGRILESERPDVLHTHGGVAGLWGRRAARRARTPGVVHTLHGIHYLHYRNPVLKRAMIVLERRLSRTTAAVVVVSRADLESARRWRLAPAGRLRLIYNGLDFARTAAAPGELRIELGLSPETFLAGAVSRLHRQKGLVHFVRAAALVRTLVPAAAFAVAGGGPLHGKLRAEIRKHGLEGAFHLLGERADSGRDLAAFDLLVLPSLWEGLPYVLLEAASLGKPIVATDIPGVREVVRDGENGLLVPAGEHERLAAAIVRLATDPGLAGRLGGAARDGIPPLFSLERTLGETERLYLEVAGAPGPHRRGG